MWLYATPNANVMDILSVAPSEASFVGDCSMWLYATPNAKVMDILSVAPSEASFVGEEYTDAKEGDLQVGILGAGEHQADWQTLCPLPVTAQRPFMGNTPNCHARHTHRCSTPRTMV
jgi:ethanolamine utilization microcompartment shell protein EutS